MSRINFVDGAVFDFYKPHEPVDISDWSPSLTRQEFAEECDINVIMARYERTGQLPVNQAEPFYIDMTAMPSDFQTAMNLMIDADKAFMMLPANVRREFDNDPVKFVEFASDGENLDQMRSWGLAPPKGPEPVLGPVPGTGDASPVSIPGPPAAASKAP